MMDAQDVVGFSDRVCQRAVKCRVGRPPHNWTGHEKPRVVALFVVPTACAFREDDELGGKETRGAHQCDEAEAPRQGSLGHEEDQARERGQKTSRLSSRLYT